MYLLNLCSHSGPLNVFYILKVAFKIICTILPLLIMFRFTVAMFKSVLSGGEISKELYSVIKSTVAALIIFLLPTFFQFLFVDLLKADDVEIISCFNNATLENVRSLREAEKIAEQEELDELNASKADELNRQKEIEKQKNEEKKKVNEEIKKKKEEEERKKREEEEARRQQQNQQSGGSTDTNLKPAGRNIIVGDSRTVGMCITMTGSSSGCSYNNGGPKYANSDIYISQGSMSYAWFSSTAVSAVNSILASNPDTTFNIYSLMGANMLLYDIDRYIPLYNSLAKGSWSKHNLILVSVNPVDEAKEAQCGYKTKNSDIITFNNKLRSGVTGSNVKYCDTYNSVLNSLGTTDGLHYDGATYQLIYSRMKSCGS